MPRVLAAAPPFDWIKPQFALLLFLFCLWWKRRQRSKASAAAPKTPALESVTTSPSESNDSHAPQKSNGPGASPDENGGSLVQTHLREWRVSGADSTQRESVDGHHIMAGQKGACWRCQH